MYTLDMLQLVIGTDKRLHHVRSVGVLQMLQSRQESMDLYI